MKRLKHRRTLIKTLLLALGLIAYPWTNSRAQTPFKVFMIASKASDHIAMSTEAKIQVEKLGAANGFTVDYTTDPALITEANLAKYQVFLQCHFAPFEMSVAQRAIFQKFIDDGKGWVGIHAAGLTGDQFNPSMPTWTWYTEFFGGITWVVHPALQTGTILFEDRTHPITQNLPASFQLKDEWYEWNKNPRPNVHVLAKADESTYKQVKPQGDHPMIWCNPKYPKMVYIGIGHDVSDWTNANYILLIREALMWAKPATTRIDARAAAKGYLGAPVAQGGAWIHNGVIGLEGGAATAASVDAGWRGAGGWNGNGRTDGESLGEIRLMDVSGRRLSVLPLTTPR